MFFDSRYERLIRQIEAATGRPVNRGDDHGSPFAAHRSGAAVAQAIQLLIKAGESKVVEFKSTGRKNLSTGAKDSAIEWSVVKTIAGFMNSHGGTLLVGVQDDGSVLGLEEDFAVFSKKDADSWEQWLTQLLINHFGEASDDQRDRQIRHRQRPHGRADRRRAGPRTGIHDADEGRSEGRDIPRTDQQHHAGADGFAGRHLVLADKLLPLSCT